MQRLSKITKDYPLLLFWVIVAVLYLPAWHAGFVTDAIDWLHDVQTLPLGEYLNRSHSAVHALYQTTQLLTLGFYKLFGTARLPWFLLFVTLHAGSAYLLFIFFAGIFRFANLRKPGRIALWGAIFFCVTPYASEVVVWKACFHYPQGLMLMLGTLICMQRFLHNEPKLAWAWLAAVLYLLSAFAL